MAIAATDIDYILSGGASNTDPNLALGGIISTVAGGIITSDSINNDMDDITSAEASVGITIYHGYFYENTHATLTYISPAFYISSQTSSGDTSVAIAVADELKNLAMETIANEETAPVGPTFTTPANFAAGITLNDLDASDFRGTWVKYIVGASASAVLDSYTIGIQGDSNP